MSGSWRGMSGLFLSFSFTRRTGQSPTMAGIASALCADMVQLPQQKHVVSLLACIALTVLIITTATSHKCLLCVPLSSRVAAALLVPACTGLRW